METRSEISLPKHPRHRAATTMAKAARAAQNNRTNEREQCLFTCVLPFVLSLQSNIVKCSNPASTVFFLYLKLKVVPTNLTVCVHAGVRIKMIDSWES